MSHIYNTQFLESAYEDFKDYLYRKDWESAKKVIDEVASEGFVKEGVDLCKELLVAKTRMV